MINIVALTLDFIFAIDTVSAAPAGVGSDHRNLYINAPPITGMARGPAPLCTIGHNRTNRSIGDGTARLFTSRGPMSLVGP